MLPLPLRRRHGGVLRLEARVGRRDLLRRRVVRHQLVDHGRGRRRRRRRPSLTRSMNARRSMSTVDVEVVGLDGLAGQFFRLHAVLL